MDEADVDAMERVTIELPVSFLEEVREAVAAGEYTSFDKAIEQAVHDWTADRTIERIGVDELRRLIDEGLASGDAQPLDVEEVIREAMIRADDLRKATKMAS